MTTFISLVTLFSCLTITVLEILWANERRRRSSALNIKSKYSFYVLTASHNARTSIRLNNLQRSSTLFYAPKCKSVFWNDVRSEYIACLFFYWKRNNYVTDAESGQEEILAPKKSNINQRELKVKDSQKWKRATNHHSYTHHSDIISFTSLSVQFSWMTWKLT